MIYFKLNFKNALSPITDQYSDPLGERVKSRETCSWPNKTNSDVFGYFICY